MYANINLQCVYIVSTVNEFFCGEHWWVWKTLEYWFTESQCLILAETEEGLISGLIYIRRSLGSDYAGRLLRSNGAVGFYEEGQTRILRLLDETETDPKVETDDEDESLVDD